MGLAEVHIREMNMAKDEHLQFAKYDGDKVKIWSYDVSLRSRAREKCSQPIFTKQADSLEYVEVVNLTLT